MLFICSFVLILLVFTACGAETPKEYRKNFSSMDTQIFVKIYDTKKADDILLEVVQIYEKFNNLTDKYKDYDTNGVYDINANAGIAPVQVEMDLIELLKNSIKYAELTNNEFNPAIGAVTTIWHEYRENCLTNNICSLPTDFELNEAKNLTNISDIVINEDEKTVFLAKEGMSLDLGGIAKGYTTQKVAEYLYNNNFENFIINAGGNVTTGKHPENRPWRVGLTDPDNIGNYFEVVEVLKKSVVSSGDYQRYYEYEGQKYHHIIDNKTQKPLNLYKGVSVVCDDSSIADILSTSLFNISIDEGKELLNKFEGEFEVYWYKANSEMIKYEKS